MGFFMAKILLFLGLVGQHISCMRSFPKLMTKKMTTTMK